MNVNNTSYAAIAALLVGVAYSSEARCSAPLEITVAQEGFAATYYDPPEGATPVGVVVLGGSEGGRSARRAKAFAAEGYAVLSLAYFKEAGTPDYLDEIPLEYFDKPIEWFAERPAMQGKKIVLVGGSKGAELALLLASRKAEVAGVIAISPSSVAFQGIPRVFWPPRSSWSYKGKPLPFVPYDVSQGVDPTNLRPLYELSLSHADVVAKASIPVEKIKGPILLLSGEDDGMWPASDMAESIVARLKENKFPHAFEHVPYEDAGHTLNEFFMLGGTREGNQTARVDAWRRMRVFLLQIGNGV
ncbi:MAG: dienelactone hydrolase family protein [Planctomycetes bacterium]|nr:dienelactone hydrolase family protein [Planctomycetota bacterium]